MAPSACIELTRAEQARLLTIASDSIAGGLKTRQPLEVDMAGLTGALAEPRGNFVTLTINEELRGCVGTLTGIAPLAQEIAVTAYNAASQDRRFRPLDVSEFEYTRIDISVLSQPEPLPANDLNELLDKVRPRAHGLIVEDLGQRATLLPKVWEKVCDAQEFIMHLMLKAGLPPGHWSNTIRFYSYEAFEFASDAPAGESGKPEVRA